MNLTNCATLSTRNDFPGYIAFIRNATHGNFSLVAECRQEICGALWGSGNPDISGIGMAVGYVLESMLATTIICTFILLRFRPQMGTKTARLLLFNAARTFFDNAIFFTFAIQLASIFTLTLANFGVSTAGMGAITMKIAWLVSTLTLLPLLPFALSPELFMDGKKKVTTPPVEALDAPSDERDKCPFECVSEREIKRTKARQGERFLLLVVCWALSFYPFFSRMAGTFGKSQIGDSDSSAISTNDWSLVEEACFKDVAIVSSTAEATMTAFGVASWLLVTIIMIYKIIVSAMKGAYERQWKWLKDHDLIIDPCAPFGFRAWMCLGVMVLIILLVQLWAFFRLRRFQGDMNVAAGGQFPDGQWTFGQIVAVVVFFPTTVEVVFLWRKRSLY